MSLHFSQDSGLPTANPRSRTRIYLGRFLVFFAMIFSAASLPAEIVIDTSGTVTSISGLDVDGQKYDVTFSQLSESFNDFFGDPTLPTFVTPTFWGNSTGASNAVDALVAALNAYNLNINNSPTITGVGASGNLFALVPYDYSSVANTVQSDSLNRNGPLWTNGETYNNGPNNDFWGGVWVDFSPWPAPVPETATLGTWFCLSLAGYGGLLYRRRSANSLTRE
jgi:hypothetical protein